MDYSLLGSSVHGMLQYCRGLPFPPPEHLTDPGIKPTSLTSPALAGRLFTASITWEALWNHRTIYKSRLLLRTLWAAEVDTHPGTPALCTLQGYTCASAWSLLIGGPAWPALTGRPENTAGGGSPGRGHASWPSRPKFKASWPRAVGLGSQGRLPRAGVPSEWPHLARPPDTSLTYAYHSHDARMKAQWGQRPSILCYMRNS